MPHIIAKFGGTSVSSLENWKNIVIITQKHIAAGLQPVIVCSALTQVTNLLEQAIEAALINQHEQFIKQINNKYTELAQALAVPDLITQDITQLTQLLTGITLIKQAPAKTRAEILALGEIMLTRLGCAYLQAQGLETVWLDARKLLRASPIPGGENINYLAARCDFSPNAVLRQELLATKAEVFITQGFVAANAQGETVLLGRGGSDTSGALLAAILQAEACEIWTDVPGIYTANPQQLPNARLLKQLNYDEAQEIASMGAKVLHPHCLTPVRQAGIPLFVKFTKKPDHSGTRITHESDLQAPLIKSVQVKYNIILISIDTVRMWHQVGFLADVFNTFKKHGFSVDLLSSSESNVTLSLDTDAKLKERETLQDLLADLNTLGRAKVIEPCSAVSLVGHQIRTVLPQLGPVLEVFESQQIYLMSLASNDLNLTFVVDETQADKLCQKLHLLLVENNPQTAFYSKTWLEEFGSPPATPQLWWQNEQKRLLQLAQSHSPCFIYHLPTIEKKAQVLLNLRAIDGLFYAIKANPHPKILQTLAQKNVAFECVSMEELQHIAQLFPQLEPHKLLFTPNFAPQEEYAFALNHQYHVTIDNLYPLQNWPELFKDKSILVRLDPGCGAGHHKYVCTGGNESKFGIPQEQLETLIDLVKRNRINVVGLHAHWGSGILSPDLWQQTALFLTKLKHHFPQVKILNLGGGLGVAEKPGQQALNLSAVDDSLLMVKKSFPDLHFWLEPGRFFVAEAGIILAKVTQLKEKGRVNFIGLETGMNSLLRPALYGSYHEIINLTRLQDERNKLAHIVGPICESGDTLGYDRLVPQTYENDIFLIANAGAYGHCMSSCYNLRPPAKELILEQADDFGYPP